VQTDGVTLTMLRYLAGTQVYSVTVSVGQISASESGDNNSVGK
jgi:hypothetical protein